MFCHLAEAEEGFAVAAAVGSACCLFPNITDRTCRQSLHVGHLHLTRLRTTPGHSLVALSINYCAIELYISTCEAGACTKYLCLDAYRYRIALVIMTPTALIHLTKGS